MATKAGLTIYVCWLVYTDSDLFVLFTLYIIIPYVSDTMPKGDIGDVPS